MAARRLGWRTALAALPVLALALLAGCGSAPRSSLPAAIDASRDGAPIDPPADLAQRPDPEPRIEPIRSAGPNKPYEVLGQRYTPLSTDAPVTEKGLASWYGRKFHGRPTASGEIYDMYASSAAHRTMPIPSYARVRNPANGREVVVRINDRGPFHADRIIDLSYAAALKLGVLSGVAPVEVQRLTHEDIRSQRWRAETVLVQAAAPAPTPAALPLASSPMWATAPLAATTAGPPAAATIGPVPSQAASIAEPRIDASAAPAAPVPESPAGDPAAATATPTKAAGAARYWVQLGAFRQREGALDLHRQLMRELAWLEPWLSVFDDSALFKVQAGPFASRSEALGAAERLRRAAAAPPPMIVQRR